jgi:competence protein ComEC
MRKKTKQIVGRIAGITLLAVLSILINQYITMSDQEASRNAPIPDGIMEVHFIDVGQGDAIFVETGNSTMLIDAGENSKGSLVREYLISQQVDKLDYVIGTHPHSDHIGGLDTILDSFEVNKVLLPDAVHTTDTFEDVLDSLEKQQLKVTRPVVGDRYSFGDASFTILAPNSSDYADLNDYSISIRLTYGNTSFLLTGDAEKLSEDEMLKNGLDLSAEVLKLGHHGSAYSSNTKFINAVSPSFAVISAGKDNKYGHPHAETLQAMQEHNIKVYRTDEQGSIVFTSDGQTVSVNKQAYSITEQDLAK